MSPPPLPPGGTTFATFVANTFLPLVDSAIALVMALAVLGFVFGVIKFMSANDNNARAEGKKIVGWGLVALFAMVSVWGLVAIIKKTFLG